MLLEILDLGYSINVPVLFKIVRRYILRKKSEFFLLDALTLVVEGCLLNAWCMQKAERMIVGRDEAGSLQLHQ
ncbi:hypothetical protein L1987_61957 [Smallanthus sonchifolius]|uniref:Uncharacterized protein n=1 Tax=Smallanthus sonchifolius TaxID=185202 RepID=A0ACB9C954_9ASTR|nr:hypothetical protein L1987_61957 [Smallanthus sonchifolius]